MLVLDELHCTTQMPPGGGKGDTNNPNDNGDGHSPRTVFNGDFWIKIIVLAYFCASLVVCPLVVKVGDIHLVAGAAQGDSIWGFLEYIIDTILVLLVLFGNPVRQLVDVCLA